MEYIAALILAAGEGKRMKSNTSKVLHKVAGKPVVEWVYESVKKAGIEDSILVVGHKADQVKEYMKDRVKYAFQEKQLGTGHAVMQAEEFLAGKDGYVLVLYGDTPLITSQTISDTLKFHKENNNSATVITAELSDPTGYGRIVRDDKGNVLRIVEHKDANDEERSIKEVNSGMYCFTIKYLLEALKGLSNNNSQGEYYLTDTLEILINRGLKVGTIKVADSSEILGINDRVQLAEASEIMRRRILTKLMKSGVTIIDPASTYIDDGVEIGMDTIIYPGTILEKGTVIGENCIIGPNSRIVGATIGNNVEVNNSVVLESTVGDDTHVGPFAYMRPGSTVGRHVKIGDFVEIKNSNIGDETKISHLTYVGDADVGKNVNLGCGVVFVNYDGKKKNRTVVGDNAFIGCNVNLVSPVKVGEDAYIAAGSTITEEVPENSLAIARCRQTIKENWVINRGMQRKKD